MSDHCSPYCPFLACDGCPYQGGIDDPPSHPCRPLEDVRTT